MIFLFMMLTYKDDCKKYGKENLAVSLSERLLQYFLLVVIPLYIALK